MTRARHLGPSLLALPFLVCCVGCREDVVDSTPTADTTAPSAISDLSYASVTAGALVLAWTAPGDDGTDGEATVYDLRRATGTTSDFEWDEAAALSGEPSPRLAGGQESFTVSGLDASTHYTFALKTADEEENWSEVSNLLEVETGDASGECAVDPSVLSFGSVSVGSYSERTFTITNRGSVDLSGTVSETSDAFSLSEGGGAYSLAPDESLEVIVRYAPTAAGTHTGVIETGDATCTDVTCTGVAVAASQGYTLFAPNGSRLTYLVDENLTIVHSWSHDRSGGYSVYLLEDGSILRTAVGGSSSMNAGGAQGVVQRVGPTGTVLWEYVYSSSAHRAHHDIEPMPNGNVLLVAWELKSAAEAAQAGRAQAAAIWPDHIVEVQPVGSSGGTIVWEWHAWDHLVQDRDAAKNNYGVVSDHPELLDVNMGSGGGLGGGDWMHLNGISYRSDWDQILVSSHELDEIYVIDHSTTTLEAAGHTGGNSGKGGDLLYRWGCPANYDAPGSRTFNVVHCANWIPDGRPGAGNILAFNNRENQSTSIVVELVPPADAQGNYYRASGSAYGPAAPTWSYTASGFYSSHLGSCQRLPDGNTLIVESAEGRIFEVDESGTIQWSYPRGGEISRALRYPTEYVGLAPLGVGGAQ